MRSKKGDLRLGRYRFVLVANGNGGTCCAMRCEHRALCRADQWRVSAEMVVTRHRREMLGLKDYARCRMRLRMDNPPHSTLALGS